ncbi:unnamed protein product, partial [Ectocarpus sp. 12 AP-2014]
TSTLSVETVHRRNGRLRTETYDLSWQNHHPHKAPPLYCKSNHIHTLQHGMFLLALKLPTPRLAKQATQCDTHNQNSIRNETSQTFTRYRPWVCCHSCGRLRKAGFIKLHVN